MSFALSSCKINTHADYYIFQNISECQALSKLGLEDEKLTPYENAEVDKHLNALHYTDFFAAKYTSSTLEFEIFAYTFENTKSAQSYFANLTGKNDTLETNFLISGGIAGNYEMIVIDGKNAYSIITPKAYLDEIINLLSSVFTKKLDI